MEKQILDDNLTLLISDSARCLKKKNAYVGEKNYTLCLFAGEEENDKNTCYIAATENDVLLSIGTIRDDLDEMSAERMNKDLIKRLSDLLGNNIEVVSVVSSEKNTHETEQPLLIKIVSTKKLSADDKIISMSCSEINDWLDELVVMKSAKVTQKQYESYQQEYEKIISANLIPHDKQEPKDYSTMMSIITAVCAIMSIFFYEMCVFPVITIVSGVFSSYRCYSNKNYKALVICILGIVIGIIFTYFGWTEFTSSMNK